MHNLDKSMLTLAAHTEFADAFLIKVGALPKPQPCQAELSSRNSTGLYSRNGKSAPRLAALNGNATPAASRARRSWHFCATFSALFADVPLGDLQIAPVQYEIEGYNRWYETLIVLRAPDGSVAGLTEAMWDSRTPTVPSATHRCGQAVACARSRQGPEGRDLASGARKPPRGPKIMKTENGETNAAMRSINARAGFKPEIGASLNC